MNIDIKAMEAATIREAEKWMKEQGVKKIYINSRTAAVQFYEKLGLFLTGIRNQEKVPLNA